MRSRRQRCGFFVLFLAAVAVTVPTVPVAATARCSSAASATYRHSFDGPEGTVAVTATQPLCAGERQAFSLASYTISNPGSFLYDRASGTISSANGRLSLAVAVPSCATGVTAVLGTGLPTETTGGVTDDGFRLGSAGSRSTGPVAWYSSGATTCSPAARVTFVNACDGRLTATLANDGAGLTAVFVAGGRLIRVAPGRATTVRAAPGGTLTVRASTFTTYIGTWRPPAAGCASAITAPPAASAGARPPVAPTVTVTSFHAPTSPATFVAEERAPEFPIGPAAQNTSAAAAQSADSGMSAGSIVTTTIGLLMVVIGATVLTRLIRDLRRPS